MTEPTLRVLSLGAGVQSSTVYLMAVQGEFGPRPEVAIFADTQWEPAYVYEWLSKLEEYGAGVLPIHRVTAGSVRVDALRSKYGRRFATMPLHVTNELGDGGMLRRQCTREYKVAPITKHIRELLGVPKGRKVGKGVLVEQWYGISLDEATRMRDSRDKWIQNRYPLIERGMSRRDCLRWMQERGYPEPAKSACIGCPFHGDAQWRRMRDEDPVAWQDAVEFDRAIRHGPKLRGVEGTAYLHRSLKPLDEVDLRTAGELGQADLFNAECEGMCGV